MPPKKQIKSITPDAYFISTQSHYNRLIRHRYHYISALLRTEIGCSTTRPQYLNFNDEFFVLSQRLKFQIIHCLKTHFIRPNFRKGEGYFERNKITHRHFSPRDILLIYANMNTPLKVILRQNPGNSFYYAKIFKRFKNIKRISGEYHINYGYWDEEDDPNSDYSYSTIKNCLKNLRFPQKFEFSDLKISPVIRYFRKVQHLTLFSEDSDPPINFDFSINSGILRAIKKIPHTTINIYFRRDSKLKSGCFEASSLLKKLEGVQHLTVVTEDYAWQSSLVVFDSLKSPKSKVEKLELTFETKDPSFQGKSLTCLKSIVGLKHLLLNIYTHSQCHFEYDYLLKILSEITTLESCIIKAQRKYYSYTPDLLVELKTEKILSLVISENQQVENLSEIVKNWPGLLEVQIIDISKDKDRNASFYWFEALIQKSGLIGFEIIENLKDAGRNFINLNEKKEIFATLLDNYSIEDLETVITTKDCSLKILEFVPKKNEGNIF